MRSKKFGYAFRPTYRDKRTGETKRQAVWWIQWSEHGQVKRESSGSESEQDAWALLNRKEIELAAGLPTDPAINRTTFEDLAAILTDDYIANGYRSLKRCEDAVNHLRSFFAGYKGIQITGDRVTAYAAHRLAQKAARATINNELAALSRMFTLGIQVGKIARKPVIKKLKVSNARKGFFEREQFNAILANLPEDLKAVAVTAYITGWRVHDEILTREIKHVDLKAGWLRLDPGETKNGEGRNFPLIVELRDVLAHQIARTRQIERDENKIIPYLFHRGGVLIKSFRRAWLTACVAAGLGSEIRDTRGKLIKKKAGRIPHDFRRTAVRNLERAGVSRSAAMAMVGHKTAAIYNRYAIADETSLREAGTKLTAFHASAEKCESFERAKQL